MPLDDRFSQIDDRFSQIDARPDAQTDVICRRMDEGFRHLRVEMAGMRKEMRTILLALVGFMLSCRAGRRDGRAAATARRSASRSGRAMAAR